MKRWKPQDVVREDLIDALEPLFSYWYLYDTIQQYNNVSDEEKLQAVTTLNIIKRNYGKVMSLIEDIMIENDKYLMLLIYEKIYFESHHRTDYRIDCFCLSNKLKELVENIK